LRAGRALKDIITIIDQILSSSTRRHARPIFWEHDRSLVGVLQIFIKAVVTAWFCGAETLKAIIRVVFIRVVAVLA
jgi:hypothetical protein